MKRFYYGLIGVGLAALALAPTIQGCGESSKAAAQSLAAQCGIECAAEGVAKGNASITGVAGIDGFFASVVNFNAKANAVTDGINAELAAIAASVDLDGGAKADFSGKFQSAVKAKFNLDSDLKVAYQPAKCEVSAKATIEATARCDVKVDPGSVKAECSGSCEVDPAKVDLKAACEGNVDAKLTCTGTAPNLQCSGQCSGECQLDVAASCSGSCTGSCQLDVAAACSGTCTGSCDGNCDGKCDGNTSSGAKCSGSCEGQCSGSCKGNCQLSAGGSCSGSCKGSCQLEAAGSCSGSCKGSCQYTPPSASCEGGAKAEVHCEASGSATPPKVKCDGKCDAEITPPSASAECQAKAKADAKVNVECTPPSIGVTYRLKAVAGADATANAKAKAVFEAWLNQFKGHLSAIVAMKAQAGVVVDAGAGIATAASGAVNAAAAKLKESPNFAVAFKIGSCLPKELAAVPTIITTATGNLNASVTSATSLVAAVGGK
jgi:hypothetical protein